MSPIVQVLNYMAVAWFAAAVVFATNATRTWSMLHKLTEELPCPTWYHVVNSFGDFQMRKAVKFLALAVLFAIVSLCVHLFGTR